MNTINKFIHSFSHLHVDKSKGAPALHKPILLYTISNSNSLCPNLHCAFDRGLISIDNAFKVIVNPFNEAENSFLIRQFKGKQILLPANPDYLPSQANLEIRRARFNFQ